jgi:hypothetical protein
MSGCMPPILLQLTDLSSHQDTYFTSWTFGDLVLFIFLHYDNLFSSSKNIRKRRGKCEGGKNVCG